MADSPENDEARSEPSLELPSLFRRRRRGASAEAETPAEEPRDTEPEPHAEPQPEPEPVVEDTQVVEPVVEPEPEPAAAPARRGLFRRRAAEPTATEPEPAPEQAPTPEPEPTPDPTPDPAPVARSAAAPTPRGPDFLEPEPIAAPVRTEEHPAHDPDDQDQPEEEPRRTRELNLPQVPAVVAVVVTGLLVGLLGIGVASLSVQGCEMARGVGSCGGFGVVALLVVLAVQVWVAAALLRALGVADPGVLSFLAIGVVAIVTMLFLLDSIESRSMLVVLPVLTAVCFLVSLGATRTFVEDKTPRF